MLNLDCCKNWDALTSRKLNLIVELIDIIEDYYKMSKIAKWFF